MGTFLTTTGDYRFLAGRLGVDGLHLSTFDGAHAFLFRGRVQWPGLRGDFWSRDTWHETWTAEWAPHAELPDAFGRTKWIDGTSLTHLTFPDLDGNLRSLGEPAFAGKARIVQVFGSWCPNCHDEAPFLAELHERYAKDGLSIVGLAFELTGDFERDAEQVRRYRDRHGIEFPLLLAGTADKERATAALGALDRVRSFPTTIFLRPEGSVARVHSGFAGPGAGDEHERLRSEFTDVVEGLLREPAADDAPFWKWLRAGPFALLEPLGGAKLEFHEEDGRRVVRRVGRDRRGAPGDVVLPVELNYATVRFGGANWHLDTGARVLLDPLDFGRRIFPQEDGPTPLLTRKKRPLSQELLLAALEHEDPLVRREGLFALAQLRSEEGARGFPEVLPWLSDEELETELRVAAAWAVGLTFDRRAVDDLVACLDHPYAPLRREAARSLARMSPHVLDLRERLKDRPADPDPLVRLAIEAALR